MRKVAVAALGSFVILLSVAWASPAEAACSTLSSNGHCYAQAYWAVSAPSGFHGASTDVRSNCLSVSNNQTQFINNELWVISGSYWIEAGITVGAKSAGGYVSSPTAFWAQNHPSLGYVETYGGGVSLNTAYRAAVAYVSSGNWTVRSGSLTGTISSTFAGNAYELQAGNEAYTSTSTDPITYGSVSSLTYKSLTNTDVSGWTNASLYNAGTSSSTWITYPTWLRNSFNYTVC